jgi:hypothetical protein
MRTLNTCSDGADVEHKMEDGKLIEHERSGQLYDAAFDDVQTRTGNTARRTCYPK